MFVHCPAVLTDGQSRIFLDLVIQKKQHIYVCVEYICVNKNNKVIMHSNNLIIVNCEKSPKLA